MVIFTQTDLPLLILFYTNISSGNNRKRLVHSIACLLLSNKIVFKHWFLFHPIAAISMAFDLFIRQICFVSYPLCTLKSLSIYNYLGLHVKRYVFVCRHAYRHLIPIFLHYIRKSREHSIINDVSVNVTDICVYIHT